MNDLRDVENGVELKITMESGEVFEGAVVGYTHDEHTDYSAEHVSFPFEGDLWDQVKDRLDHEVLHVQQTFERRTGTPGGITVTGTIVDGEMHESVSMGVVEAIKVLE